jgi:hypothetical protein
MSVGIFADLFDLVTCGDRDLIARLRASSAQRVPASTGPVAL